MGERTGVIEARHLQKSYQKKVIDDLSFEIARGDTVLVTGESGAGKTTLMRLLLGLEKPDAGSVSNGLGKIAVVFQEDRLLERFDITANIRLVSKLSKDRIYEEYSKLLPSESFGKRVGSYSGGMKRRAAVLRALLCDSAAVFLDEPFVGLDEESRQRTMEFVSENINGRALLLITHEKSEADFFAPNREITIH